METINSKIPSLTLKNKTLDFSFVTGIVLKVDKRSENHSIVSTTTQQGGKYTPSSTTTKVSNIVLTVTDLWLRTPNGNEINLTYKSDLALREGHQVSFVSVVKKNKEMIWFWYNHSSGSYANINGYETVLRWIGLWVNRFYIAGILLVLGAVIGFAKDGGAAGLLGALIGFLVGRGIDMILNRNENKTRQEELGKHRDSIATWLGENL
jgi:hypothetical protein